MISFALSEQQSKKHSLHACKIRDRLSRNSVKQPLHGHRCNLLRRFLLPIRYRLEPFYRVSVIERPVWNTQLRRDEISRYMQSTLLQYCQTTSLTTTEITTPTSHAWKTMKKSCRKYPIIHPTAPKERIIQ